MAQKLIRRRLTATPHVCITIIQEYRANLSVRFVEI